MSRPNIKHGCVMGNGAAINVELGWIPDSVDFYNATDGTPWQTAFLIPWTITFTSGGTAEILAGTSIRGATSGATATVESVLLSSGSWSGGDAAGVLTLKEDPPYTGTFTTGGEAIIATNLASGTIGTDDASITANFAGVVHNVAITTAAAAVTFVGSPTTFITRYAGSSGSAAKGFTIASGLAVEAKLIRYRAFRGDVV